jgi:hypothetical protein
MLLNLYPSCFPLWGLGGCSLWLKKLFETPSPDSTFMARYLIHLTLKKYFFFIVGIEKKCTFAENNNISKIVFIVI